MSPIDLDTHALARWTGPLGLPDFARIGDDDFAPVFDLAMQRHAEEIEAIAGNPEAPTIDNTLAALELAGEALDRVSSIFWCLAGAHTNEAIQALERDLSPKLSRHFSAISMNERLFARLDALHARRDALGLDPATLRLLERTWKGFVKSGARLDEAGKKRLAEVNEELSALGTAFGQNLLADESGWALFLGEEDLAGIPGFLENRPELYSRGDADSEEWRAFTSAWWNEHGDTPVKVGDLQRLAEETLLSWLETLKDGASDKTVRTKLGKAIASRRDTRFDTLFVRQASAEPEPSAR